MRNARSRLSATLRSTRQPTKEQLARFTRFLETKYRRKVPLRWEQDESLRAGFRLQVGSDVYDWTLDGRVRQFQDYLRQLEPGQEDLLPLMGRRWSTGSWPPPRRRSERCSLWTGRLPQWGGWNTPSTGRF